MLAEELGMRPLQAHCHLGLGRLYAETGQREQARAELSAASEMYRSMEMTFLAPPGGGGAGADGGMSSRECAASQVVGVADCHEP